MDKAPLVLAPVCVKQSFETGADLDQAWQADWPAAIRVTDRDFAKICAWMPPR